MKADALRPFLGGLADGTRCSGKIKIDTNTDFTKLRVIQLKQLLKDRGITCLECIEKADYVSRLQQLVSTVK